MCVSYLAKMYQIANIFLAVNLIGWFECFLIQECVSYYSNPVIHVFFNNKIKDGSSTFEFKLLISNTLKLIISRIESVLGVKMFLIKKYYETNYSTIFCFLFVTVTVTVKVAINHNV